MDAHSSEDSRNAITELCRLARIVEDGGGKFVAIQSGLHSVMFTHTLCDTALTAPISGLTPDLIRAQILSAVKKQVSKRNAVFGKSEERVA